MKRYAQKQEEHENRNENTLRASLHMNRFGRTRIRRPHTHEKIAERQLISKKYLEQVVAPLSEAGLITVARGATGGYAIARPAREITLDEIVQATEGRPLYLLDCLEGSFDCPLSMRCSTQRVWKGLEHAVTSYLRGITLEDALDLERSVH